MNFTLQIARTFSTFTAFGFLVCAYAAELGILLDDDTKALGNSFSFCYHVLEFSLASAMACVACLTLVYADFFTTALHHFKTTLLLLYLHSEVFSEGSRGLRRWFWRKVRGRLKPLKLRPLAP
jgi:hypothetical protein